MITGVVRCRAKLGQLPEPNDGNWTMTMVEEVEEPLSEGDLVFILRRNPSLEGLPHLGTIVVCVSRVGIGWLWEKEVQELL